MEKSNVTNPTAAGQKAIKKKSKVPGVMITQFVEKLPEGTTTPDFSRKPIAITIQEGKSTLFKAIVVGNPKPVVTWTRAGGQIVFHPDTCRQNYNESSHEHTLEFPKVVPEDADTYKCYATNDYGRAICTALLTVIEVGFSKTKELQKTYGDEIPDFLRKKLKKRAPQVGAHDDKAAIPEEKILEILMNADKKDYERICMEYGFTNFRGMLKRLKQMKQEEEDFDDAEDEETAPLERREYDDVKPPPKLAKVSKKYRAEIDSVQVERGSSLDIEEANVDFDVKIQEAEATERQEDAIFTCVLAEPLDEVQWVGKDGPLTDGEKFQIGVSQDKLTHQLIVRDCSPPDTGVYAAVAGDKYCSARLIVGATKESGQEKQAPQKSMAQDRVLPKVPEEKQERPQKETGVKLATAEKAPPPPLASPEPPRREEPPAAAKKEAVPAKAEAKAAAPRKETAEARVVEEPSEAPVEEDEDVGECSLFIESHEEVEATGGEVAPVQEIIQESRRRAIGRPRSYDSTSESFEEGRETFLKGGASSVESALRCGWGSLRPSEGVANLWLDRSSDPGVHFHVGLSDCKAIIGEDAELVCKLSSEECEGIWYKDGEEIKSNEGMTILKEGSYHKLQLHKVPEEFAGKYKFEADGRKTEATVVVEDPPRFDPEELKTFLAPVTVKKGYKATFKLAYVGRLPIKVQWFLEGEELSDEANVKLEMSEGSTRLLLIKLQRKDSGEVKLKLKNEFGIAEAITQLVVLDKPSPPMGPLEIAEASSSAIEIKWRPPKDAGGCQIANYILERQQVGRNTWKKVGPIGPLAKYRDPDVDHGRRYCYRIRVETLMGTSEMMETEDIQAGTKAYPGPPSPPKVASAFKDCINLSWSPPANTGGTSIVGYNLEKRKKGSNLWGQVNPPEQLIRAKAYAVKDVVEGMEYEFRVSAINNSGAGEFSTPSDFVFARDPKKPPGKVIDLKVTDSSYTTLCLAWAKPKDIEGVEDEAKGYFVEIRPAENTEWTRCSTTSVTTNFYTVKNMKSLGMYWLRVIAVNDGGEGAPKELDNYVLAMPPPVRPRFTDTKIKSFMVVRAGNSARLTLNFEASPWPEVTWLKDDVPVGKKVTVSNAEGTSQLLIPSAERSDSGVYTIVVKNIVGQETFSIEIRVTDEPKPPGPVEIEEHVPGTVTVCWQPSPDEKRDDRLHYMVMKRDSSKRTWNTVADRIFNNKFTACNIMPGREYQFRVYAKNDMGSSKPSESPKWLISNKKEKFTLRMPRSKTCDLQCPPKFLVPLKMHTAPQGYECYMSCALKGDPTPHVTWLRNNVSLNTNTNYYISNTCGVCSLLILRVGAKDTGEYKVVAENPIGRAECSTKLTVRD
ncbi:immunoglobulin-like and fibronectin type III domain-containing protein 1 [Stigmatopora argus]